MYRPILALVVLGAVLATVVWIAASTREQRSVAMDEAHGETRAASSESSTLAPLTATEEEADAAAAPAREPAPSQREAATGPAADELARAHWVEGRVLFPEGTPADEEVFVVARGREFGDGDVQRARVERDGRFRVAFAEKSNGGWLVIEARHLYLDPTVRWKRDKEKGAPVVLEAKLGGCIAGRVVPPQGVAPDEVAGKVVVHLRRSRDGVWTQRLNELDVGRTLAFEACGLPPDDEYSFVFYSEALIGRQVVGKVEAGATTPTEIQLDHGAVLSGHVVDEFGVGVVKARLSTRVELAWPPAHQVPIRPIQSGPDGEFRVLGVWPGKTTVVAQASGYVSGLLTLDALASGEVRDGLELVLRRGNSIAGHAQWADGTPAAATLQVVNQETKEFVVGGKAADDGTFRITGLGDGEFGVKASAKRQEDVVEWSETLGREHKRKKTVWYDATAEHVDPETSDLVLVLEHRVVRGRY